MTSHINERIRDDRNELEQKLEEVWKAKYLNFDLGVH